MTTIGALYVYFLVPETRGRTLEEMDEVFGATSFAAEDDSLRLRIEQEIGLYALLGEGELVESEKVKSEYEHAEPISEPVS